MKYPTPGEYQEAVQFPASVFSDPLLQEAEPDTGPLGLPRAITGAFAVVFPMTTRAGRRAVRCFLTDVRDQSRRYRSIAAHLEDVRLPYTVEFDYQADGIRIDGKAFPILKMDWVDGVPISRYVAEHLDRPDALQDLHEKWRVMTRRLEEAGIAHGDLQHGNVLVDEKGNLHLVDYDTMFVPQLKGRKSIEVGHRNYQHPDRNEGDFNPHIDRFSAHVIDTALLACIVRPALWTRFDTGENLLFRSSDFEDPDSSALFDILLSAPARVSTAARESAPARLSAAPRLSADVSLSADAPLSAPARDPEVSPDLEPGVARSGGTRTDAAPSVDHLPSSNNHVGSAANQDARLAGLQAELTILAKVLRRACYVQPDEIPSLDDTVRRSSGREDAGGADAATMRGVDDGGDLHPDGHVAGAHRQRRRTKSSPPPRNLMERRFAAIAVSLITATVALFFLGFIVAAQILAVAAIVSLWAIAWWQYRKNPLVQRKQRIAREEVFFSKIVARLESDLSRLKANRDVLIDRKAEEYERRLEELQDAALRDRLKHHFIAEASELEGISHKTIVRLKVSGVRTAYQATPDRIQSILQLSDESKTRINLWRAALTATYRPDIPQHLSPSEERRVRRKIDIRMKEMDDEISRVKRKIDLQKGELERVRKRRAELSDIRFGSYLRRLTIGNRQ